jgi:molybdopterin-guanine dinucleotide biosynthesis protein
MSARRSPLGVILAGGDSRRFGAPKALARVGGERLVDRVRVALAAVCDEVVVAGALEVDGLRSLPDAVPGAGPLGGLVGALRHAAADGRSGVLAVACDLPLVTPRLLRALAAHAEASTAVVAPASGGRRGWEPLCAVYPVAALPALESMLRQGEHAIHGVAARVPLRLLSAEVLRAIGDPDRLFLNVNTMDDLREAERRASETPVVAVVGRKNSGKTTLVVALLAELRRRGLRVASLKHGHHAFESDQPGRDSWRHFHEGGAEATLMVGAGKVALTMRWDGEPDPAALVRDLLSGRGYDLVVVEGYKRGPFPKIEVFRRGQHDRPLAADAETSAGVLAIVTDDPRGAPGVPRIDLAPDGSHVARVADLVQARVLGRARPHGE